MIQNFKDFIKLRDDLCELMSEASAQRIASDNLDSKDIAISVLLAAHIACCNTIIQCANPTTRDVWIKLLLDGLHTTLVKNNSNQDVSANTLH